MRTGHFADHIGGNSRSDINPCWRTVALTPDADWADAGYTLYLVEVTDNAGNVRRPPADSDADAKPALPILHWSMIAARLIYRRSNQQHRPQPRSRAGDEFCATEH